MEEEDIKLSNKEIPNSKMGNNITKRKLTIQILLLK